MNAQQWESMSVQAREEWARFQQWQHAQPIHPAQAPRVVQHAAGPAHKAGQVQVGTRTVRRLLMASLGGLVLIGAVAAIANLTGPSHRTVAGSMTITKSTSSYSSSYFSSSSSRACDLSSGYDDIGAGTSVTVRDSSGDVAGVGELNAGWDNSYSCVFSFSVENVPTSDFYSVEVSHRGEVTFSDDDVENGSIQLSLG